MKKIVLTLLFIVLLASPCFAISDGEQQSLFGVEKLEDAVPRDAQEVMGKTRVDTNSAGISEALHSVVSQFEQRLLDELRSCGKGAASVLLIVILCSVMSALFDYDKTPEYITLAGCLGITAVAANGVRSLVGMGAGAINELSDFSKVLLPTLCTAAVSGGAVTSAPVKYAATAMFMDVLISVSKDFIVPLIYAYLVTVVCGAAVGGKALKSASKLIKWLCVTFMTVMTMAFTAYLGISGAVSGSADAVATKVTKTAISAALPVVGGIISDAASSVVAGAGILRSAIGAFGMISVCGICVAPVAALGAQFLLYKAAAACAAAMPSGRLSELIDGIGDACGIMLGLTGCAAVMLFVSIISSARAVTGL